MPEHKKLPVTTLLLVGMIFAAVFAMTWFQARDRFNSEKVVFAMADPAGDEHGPGTYDYPFDAIFDPKKGHFDLQQFSFFIKRNNYYFDMNFPLVTNPWGAAEGFSHTIIQIYISTNPDIGRIETFKEGANVILDPNNPWQYLIKVVSFNKTRVYWASDYEGAEGRKEGVTAQLLPDKKTIRVGVPQTLLPGDPYRWKFYVLVGSQDGIGPDNFREIKAKNDQWHFGGGTDGSYDPNVLDLLAPPKRQEQMLGSYSAEQQTLAIIEPVGPSGEVPSGPELVLDRIISIMQKIKIKL